MNELRRNIKDEILNKIHDGSLVQKPKWRFVVRVVFAVLLIILNILACVYLISFVSLVTGERHMFDLLGFGPHGVQEFILGLPWALLMIIFVLFVLLQILVRYFEFAYKKPVLIILVASTLFVGVMNYFLDTFDDTHQVPRFGEDMIHPFSLIHTEYRMGSNGDTVAGLVRNVTTETVQIEPNRSTSTLMIKVNDNLRQEIGGIEVGDEVFVLIDRENGELFAEKIRKHSPTHMNMHDIHTYKKKEQKKSENSEKNNVKDEE